MLTVQGLLSFQREEKANRKKCNKHHLRNQFKMAKLQMLIKKETFQHLKWSVQINVIVNGNVYVWSVTLKSILSYTKRIPFELTHTLHRGWNFVFILHPFHAFTRHNRREQLLLGAPGVIPASPVQTVAGGTPGSLPLVWHLLHSPEEACWCLEGSWSANWTCPTWTAARKISFFPPHPQVIFG